MPCAGRRARDRRGRLGGTFTIDQRARQGQWVDIPGTYDFAADPLIVRLSDRAHTADGIAADAAEVNCRVR